MIRVEDLHKRFSEREILAGINLRVDSGEVHAIIGPSGAGKSTLLRIINLLDEPDAGSVRLDGTDIHRTSGSERLAIRRRMAMLFQNPAVFNTTVRANIATGLRFRGLSKERIGDRVEEALSFIDMEGYGDRRATTLSGGEQQRVALARAMVTGPDLLLLDEPTANLDPVATARIEELVRRYNRESGTTVILSTHDMMQGQRLSDRLSVMMDGRFAQTGTPRDIFTEPVTTTVARFVGVRNILAGRLVAVDRGIGTVEIDGVRLEAITSLGADQPVCACIRAEDVTIHRPREDGGMGRRSSARNMFAGEISAMKPEGPVNFVTVDCGFPLEALVTWKAVEDLELAVGVRVTVSLKASAVVLVKG